MSDLIDRQSDTISRQLAIEAMEQAKEQYFDRRVIIGKMQDIVNNLPSAEPVRCKDCKHWHREIHNGIEYFNFSSCDLNHYGDGHNFYCADAERRTDG